MFNLIRVAALAAGVACASAALAAQKSYHDDALDAAATRLEQDVNKSVAGVPAKPVAALRRDADAAIAKRDYATAARAFSQIVTAMPNDAASWWKLALVTLRIAPASDTWVKSILAPILPDVKDPAERARLIDRAATAAYIGYQRADQSNDEANNLVVLGLAAAERANWDVAILALRAGLDLRKVDVVDARYQQLIAQHGFRVASYSTHPDAASPSVCFTFSESLPSRHIDFARFVAVAGQPKPTVSTDDKQLCIASLKNGEHYNVTLREGLPSAATEKLGKYANLQKSLAFDIYVPDRAPLARFASRAYVLPRAGQQGIPIVSVNTDNLLVNVYRIGDRNLIDTVINGSFKQNLASYEIDQISQERGAQVWSGSLKVDMKLNSEVTTGFPISEAVPNLAPGVYALTAKPENQVATDFDELATQWFIVSDLGLTAFSGDDGVTVFVNSLATTAPASGIEVRLMARNNEVLAVKPTDASGVVHFEAGLARGEGGLSPAMLVATDPKGDYAFLNLKAQAFDLSDRGVSGRQAPAGLDAFVYTERGVYRSGEKVYVTALLRDAQGMAAPPTPLTLVMLRPDGVEYKRELVADQGLGGRKWEIDVPASAPSGTWRVRAFIDPKRPWIGQTTFVVEDYLPDRLDFTLTSPSARISGKAPVQVNIEGHYLYGAPASNLDLDGDVKISALDELPGFAGYRFGLADEELATDKEGDPIEDLPQTDAAGKARINVKLGDLPDSTRPLQATIAVRMSEPGGRAVERTLSLPIAPAMPMIGIKPLFTGKSLGDGDTASFDVVLVSPDGKSIAGRNLRYQLLKVESQYQRYRDQDGIWQDEAVKTTRQVDNGQLDIAADKPGRIAARLGWGRYRLEVSTDDPNGPISSVGFDAGWFADAQVDTPDLLELALDKPEYRAGDSMTVAVTARAAGKLTVAVVADKILTSTTTDVTAGLARVPLTVGNNWGSGAYVVATLRRPLDVQGSRMPGRAIGVQWFSIDRAARTLAVTMTLPDLVRPRGTLRVPLKVAGLAAGEEARVVAAAVDVGILNLTNYRPPAPDDYYLGQRKLAIEIRDLYGQLIDGMQAVRGQIRTGGDMIPAELNGSPPTQPPLALYSGLVTVGPDGSAEVVFDLPDFTGSVRVMAVAWSKDKVGRGSGDVIVRDPVVVTATLPRFLLTGDRSTLRIDLDNVEGPAGDYRIAVSSDALLQVSQGNQTIRLAAKQRNGIGIALTSAGAGNGTLLAHISGPGGIEIDKSYMLAVKPATQILARRTVKPIAKGDSLTLGDDLIAGFVPGTGSLSLSIGPSTAIDAASLMEALDRYPFACSEQLTSKTLPLLYVSELLIDPKPGSDAAINEAISRLLARQTAEGAFNLWPGTSAAAGEDSGDSGDKDDVWLDTYVTDFLTRARERRFNIPDTALKLALEHLGNYLTLSEISKIDLKKDGGNLAYVYYVMARNKRPLPLSDLHYIYEQRLAEIPTAIARAQIGAAFAMLGDMPHAEGAFESTNAMLTGRPALDADRPDYGSDLRDAAAVLSLASDSGALAKVGNVVARIEQARSLTPETSTNEDAWMLLAARGLSTQAAGIVLDVAGRRHDGPVYRSFSPADLAQGITIANTGDVAVQAVLSVSGAPTSPEPAVENKGFKIERKYYTPDGKAADPAKAKQNQRFVVVLKVTEAKPQFGHVIISDFLPAGFEIDNPDLASSANSASAALPWIDAGAKTVNFEFRDDRFSAAIDRKAGDERVFSVAYVARAVSPGHYVVPQARVEDMYRPDRFGRTKTDTLDIQAAR
jgi:alpha-2-macroglobulin